VIPPTADEIASAAGQTSSCSDVRSTDDGADGASVDAGCVVEAVDGKRFASVFGSGKGYPAGGHDDRKATSLGAKWSEFGNAAYALRAAPRKYRVDNSKFMSPSVGMSFRASKDWNDRSDQTIQWGETTTGIDEGDGWLKAADGMYLPFLANGCPVLVPADPDSISASLQ